MGGKHGTETQPFEFQVLDLGEEKSCSVCFVYQPELEVLPSSTMFMLRLCRVCLRRMRATLKLAEKALPPLPKRVRPTE